MIYIAIVVGYAIIGLIGYINIKETTNQSDRKRLVVMFSLLCAAGITLWILQASDILVPNISRGLVAFMSNVLGISY